MPILVRSWQKAFTYILNGKAIQLSFFENDYARDGRGNHYAIPAVVLLKKYYKRNYAKASLTSSSIFSRDSFCCQYCGDPLPTSKLTLDHVIPKSRWKQEGSFNSWTNLVTCCRPCNEKKANHLPSECNMFPINKPYHPSYDEVFFNMNFGGRVEKEWMPYLSVFQSFQTKEAQHAIEV